MAFRIYVGTYSKYNSGSLAGEWLDVGDFADMEDFHAAARDLHKDEEDPELMFQDWEGIPSSLIGESWISPDLWEIMEQDDQEAATAYLAIFGQWDASDFTDRYRGRFDSWEAMAEELLEETGELESIPERLRAYFDFEAYARDIRLSGDLCEHSGFFFWNH